jgi:hypothetical protein
VWTAPDGDGDADKLQGGHFVMDLQKRLSSKPLVAATAAPGMR